MERTEEQKAKDREAQRKWRDTMPSEPPKITQAKADQLLSVPKFRDQYLDLVLSEYEQARSSGKCRVDARKQAFKRGALYLRVMAQPSKVGKGGNHIGKQADGFLSLLEKISESA